MADRAASRGSGAGIHGPILETALSTSGRCRENVGNTPSRAGVVQSRAARTQERFSRRGTFGEAVGLAGADFELRARCRTASLADTDAHQVSTDAGSGAVAEPTGGAAGGGAYQVVQFSFGPARRQCTTDAKGTGGGRNRSSGAGRLGRSALACHAGAVARRAGCLH